MPLDFPGVRIPETNKVVVITSITVFDTEGQEIGFIQELSPSSTRRVERIRDLSATRAGRVIEQVPSPEDLTVTGRGLCLYEQSVLRLITGFKPENTYDVWFALTHQFIPFNVVVDVKHPVTNKGWYIMFSRCWLTSYGVTYRVGELFVAETFTFQPSELISDNQPFTT